MTELKLKYNVMNKVVEANEEQKECTISQSKGTEFYESSGNAHNICFVLADGKHIFLNYSYLICGEYSESEESITLRFVTHNVYIKGYLLEQMFMKLFFNKVKKVTLVEERYLETINNQEGFATMIEISLNDQSKS